MNDLFKWHYRFLNLAKYISEWSQDPSTKVGAVIVDNKKRIVSIGYNGFPVGIQDDARLNIRDIKLQLIVHAERNALLFANKPLDDCILYTYPFMPCSVCAGMIIQSGIKHVISYINNNERWAENFKISEQMFKEAGLTLTLLKGE
jgi:dCMP deaminase